MFFGHTERPVYYPAENDYSTYSYDEIANDYNDKSPLLPFKSSDLPSIKYLNERKCPIYVHNIKLDSSVYNNYNQKVSKPRRRSSPSPKTSVNNSPKFVLDKLEESYWATWKPKKDDIAEKKMSDKLLESKQKGLNKARGDMNDSFDKYFNMTKYIANSSVVSLSKSEGEQKPSSTYPTTTEHFEETQHRKSLRKLIKRKSFRNRKIDSISQEIQTEAHCPVILDQLQEKEELCTKCDQNVPKKEPKKILRYQKKLHKNNKKEAQKAQELGEKINEEETYIKHKDSIIITKEKQEKAEPKHFQQPKCIRLYRKAGTGGYIKGGSYPLKSCLKKESHPKGNFRLGAPGSPLFVTPGSYLNRKPK